MSIVADELLLRIAVEGGAVAAAEVDDFNARIGETEATTGRASKGVGKFSNALMSMKALFAGLAIVDAVKQFSSFQSTMERLKTQTGATQAEVSRASKGILNMAVSVGTGPNSLAQAMYHIESAGYRGKKALDALRLAAEGAKVGGADLVDTTTGLTAVMVAGFKGVSTLRAAMGELNATVGAGDMTFQNLNEALGTGILATIKTLGLHVSDLGAALATLGDNNIRGAQAATRLRMGLMMLVKPSSTSVDALTKLHMGTLELANDLRKPQGLLVMLEDLKSHLTGLSKSQQAYDLASIFGGGRNSAAMMTLLDQMDRLKTKYAAVEKGGKSFNQDWKDTTKTLSFFIDQAKALGEVILIKFGGALEVVAKALQWFVQGLRHANPIAEAIAAAIMAIGTALVYAKIQTMEFTVAGAALDALPMVALFTAITLAVILLAQHFKQIKEVALDAWHWIERAAKNAFNWIKQNWPLLLDVLLGPFGLLVGFVIKHFDQIKATISSVVKWVGGVFKDLLKVLEWPFVQLYHVLRGIWDHVLTDVRWVVKEIGKLINTVLGPIKTIGHFLGGILGGAGNIASGAFNAIKGVFADGGPVSASGSYLVGERGPEIVYLNRGSYVQPNHELGGGGSDGQPSVLEATLINVLDGKVMSRSVLRQGLMAQARRGSGPAVLTDAG